jgi:hypothetical protein
MYKYAMHGIGMSTQKEWRRVAEINPPRRHGENTKEIG